MGRKPIDYTGQTIGGRFTAWAVSSRDPVVWAGVCSCGAIREEPAMKLRRVLSEGTRLARCPKCLDVALHPKSKLKPLRRESGGAWLCQCGCGRRVSLNTKVLAQTRSCGCHRSKPLEIGDRCNYLELTGFLPRDHHGQLYIETRCHHCGKEGHRVAARVFRAHKVKACGCLRRPLESESAQA